MPVTLAPFEHTIPGTLPRSIRAQLPDYRLVAAGRHVESALGLYTVVYSGQRQASLFVHPLSYPLNPMRIKEIDNLFTDPIKKIVGREFKDTTPEDLDMAVLRALRPMVSIFDRQYNFSGIRIFEHVFQRGAERYIEGIIGDLKLGA